MGLFVGGGPIVAALAFATRTERTWPEEIVKRLQLVAQMYSNAFARQRADAALRERESILRLFVEHSPAAIAMLDRKMRYLAVSQRWMTGYRLGGRNIEGLSDYEVFPEIPERWKAVHRRCQPGAIERCEEDPFPRRDGTIDCVGWEIRPCQRTDWDIGEIIIFSEPVTDAVRTRQELQLSLDQLRALAARLQNVGEEESKRLAREIHVVPGQALTAIKIDLRTLIREMGGDPEHPTKRAASILKMVDDTIESIRQISTELRPGILDTFGLVAGIE